MIQSFLSQYDAPTISALPQGTVVIVRLHFTGLIPYMCNDVENKKTLLIVLVIHYKIPFDSTCKLSNICCIYLILFYTLLIKIKKNNFSNNTSFISSYMEAFRSFPPHSIPIKEFFRCSEKGAEIGKSHISKCGDANKSPTGRMLGDENEVKIVRKLH